MASTDYLWAYSSWVSPEAYTAAMQVTPAIKLDAEQQSIYRLGFAAGYDTAKGTSETINLPTEEVDFSTMVRSSIIDADTEDSEKAETNYIVNTKTGKFHEPGCSAEKKILPENRMEIKGTFNNLVDMGYSPCGICFR